MRFFRHGENILVGRLKVVYKISVPLVMPVLTTRAAPMITYRATTRLTDAWIGLSLLGGLDRFYPDFESWYVNRAIPGIVNGDDVMIVAEDGHCMIGMALAKRGPGDSALNRDAVGEKKVRCVRVAPTYANRGIAVHLMDRILKAIDCDRPLVTVPEELVLDWSRILVNRFAFRLDRIERGLYRPKRQEFLFNVPSPPLSS